MSTRGDRFKMWSILAGVALILAVAGCSTEKTLGPQSSGQPASDRSDPRLAVAVTQGFQITTPLVVCKLIDGSVGGTIGAGRFSLTVPPGAYKGLHLITIQLPVGQCIQGRFFPEGLKFKVPATLSVDVSGTTAQANDATVYWYNPKSSKWVDIGGEYDGARGTVSTSLHHFSDYAAGRGGW